MARGISNQTKRELLAALSRRYRNSSKKSKSRILDEFVVLSGHNRS